MNATEGERFPAHLCSKNPTSVIFCSLSEISDIKSPHQCLSNDWICTGCPWLGLGSAFLCPLCTKVWELEHPECLPSGTVLLAGCIPVIREKCSLKSANHCSCRAVGALKGFQDLSKGDEEVLPSHSHHPIFPSAPAALEMS